MAEPVSPIGCALGCLLSLISLLFYFVVFAVTYSLIPVLGFLLVGRIWWLDRTSAIGVLIPTTISFLMGIGVVADSYKAPVASQEQWDYLAYSFVVIILIELTVFVCRRISVQPNHREAARIARQIGLISIATGIFLAVLTKFSPF